MKGDVMVDMSRDRYTVSRPAVMRSEIAPVKVSVREDGAGGSSVLLVDFGKAMFGTVAFVVTSEQAGVVKVHLGEMAEADGRVKRDPPGTVRYACVEVAVEAGTRRYEAKVPDDKRNTGSLAILMPEGVGQVLPLRYAEIVCEGARVDETSVRMVAAHVAFDEGAADFSCDNAVLNAVWAMCKHTMKATSFCGVYVDGDRERIPYEGDAYINQLSHYAVDGETAYQMARYSHEYLLQHPTWFTDWILHSVLMAWADYMQTGERDSLVMFYDELCARTLIDLAREDGLISTHGEVRSEAMDRRLCFDRPEHVGRKMLNDLVDWPPGSFTQGGIGERDNHEMLQVNTVVNALHYKALVIMADVAKVVGKADDAARFTSQAAKVKETIHAKLFDASKGVYVDGLGEGDVPSSHSSLHANMFPLAMGLVDEKQRESVVGFVKSRGMACSVYGAQHLLDGLYDAGEGDYALSLMTATHDRSWQAMLDQGSTVALEAWGHKYKNNLDWNHAWGAAPGNVVVRKLMGVEALEAGFGKVRVRPQVGGLVEAKLRTPTPRGTIEVMWRVGVDGGPGEVVVCVPRGVEAVVDTTYVPGARVVVEQRE